MENDNKYDPQKPTSGDVAHAVARVADGTVPIAGAGATELLNTIITPPLEKRRNEWMRKIGEGLRELEKRMAL